MAVPAAAAAPEAVAAVAVAAIRRHAWARPAGGHPMGRAPPASPSRAARAGWHRPCGRRTAMR
ncbi:hypothetical protein D9599_15690 [Roseomonas sp. KE2513]|nr:hypothetical protein [Roseomonas sp. KE2513]